MKRRTCFCAALLLAIACIASTKAAYAGTVVMTDSGNIGEFHVTNEGVNGFGVATVKFDIPNVSSQMNSVNGLFVPPETTEVLGPVTMFVTPTASPGIYSLALSPSTYDQTIGGTPGMQAELAFNMQTGIAPLLLPSYFNMSGAITSLLENSNPNFDFINFMKGGENNITLTSTSGTGLTGPVTWANFFSTPGATLTGNGSYSQAAVPEPSSMALTGVGILCLAAVFSRRRARRRTT